MVIRKEHFSLFLGNFFLELLMLIFVQGYKGKLSSVILEQEYKTA